jgi:hypothetical protein
MERVDFTRIALVGLLAYGFSVSNLPSQDTSPARRSSPPTPPQPSLSRPFTGFFRQLLATAPAEREALLARQAPAQRVVLEEKLREYEALPATEREVRLRTLDLRHYLSVLLRLPPSNRVERLATVSEPDREMVQERLKYWDRCPPEVQRDLLENEMAFRVLVGLDVTLAAPRPNATNSLPGTPDAFERALAQWKTLPVERRQAVRVHFQQVFTLSEKEKAKLLTPLGEPERRWMEYTLKAFAKLPEAQRESCIASFRKFADLSNEERTQFLTSAARWEAMSAEDRQAWRRLVTRMPTPPPPLPPDLRRGVLPPLPRTSLVATNY